VHPSAHRGDLGAFQRSANERAGVAWHRGDWKVRNVGIRDGDGVLDFVSQVAQAGAQDQADSGIGYAAPAHRVGGLRNPRGGGRDSRVGAGIHRA
jgi:hypothetical protein